jgi:hypothetical protein
MLYFISVWTLLLIGCGICGLGLLDLLQINILRQDRPFARAGDRLIIAAWLGMLAIAITLLATALFVPLSPSIGGAISIGFLTISLTSRLTRLEICAWYQRISSIHLAIYFSMAIAIAALFSHPVSWSDSGLYHYTLMRWLANFGTVPGVALLFPNFGFTSAWFAFSAPLNPDGWSDRASATANGFIFLLAGLQLLMSGWRSIQQQAQLSDWFVIIDYSCIMLFMTIRIGVMSDILVSPSPDIPAVLLVAIVTWAILTIETTTDSSQLTAARQLLPLVIAIAAVSIKLTALPLLLVTGLWFVFRAGFNGKIIHRLGIAAVLSLLLIPLLLSGIVTSGCPLYPSSAFCFDLSWAVGVDRSTANSTHHWITWYGTPPAGIDPWWWAFTHWIATTGNKSMVALGTIAAGCGIYLLKTGLDRSCCLWMMAISGVGIGFFLLTAPFNRFMVPYLFMLPALAFATYWQSHLATKSLFAKLPIQLPKITSLLMFTIAASLTVSQVGSNYSSLILPPPIVQIATVKRQINDVTYFLPTPPAYCWTNELPCAYQPARVRLRDPSQGIKAGFIRS